MGNYRSCEPRSTITAKLILQDGQLLEFSWPVSVSLLLQQNSDCFICSSDGMEFGEFAVAMGGDELLQPGELYFELPLRWRSQRLRAADMAALASKASVALACKNRDDDGRMIISCCFCGSRKVEPVMLFCEKERPLLAADGGGGCTESGGGNGGAGGSKGRKFGLKLSAIVEEI
ncbi:hypothetical protein DH2020_044865 [Rehmannia glutinosa]|uniref:Uncharacterized protein n=1 Tax=Rehmannia glutinosa TaxID=99300 RepID=A0ABR0UGG4_REHGL